MFNDSILSIFNNMFISLNAQINASICLLLGHNLLGLDRWHLSIELPVAELDPILADNQVAGEYGLLNQGREQRERPKKQADQVLLEGELDRLETLASLMILNCTMKLATRIMMNSGLLKKFLNTLISSCFSLRALISLKICSSTNTLKKIE